jgi:hypothetical protein
MSDASDQGLLEALLDSWDRNNAIRLNLGLKLADRPMTDSGSRADHVGRLDAQEVSSRLNEHLVQIWSTIAKSLI